LVSAYKTQQLKAETASLCEYLTFNFVCKRVCGTLDVGADTAPSPGITVAVSQARLHHLSAPSLEAVEAEDPSLALSLYKLVTQLRAHREEATIEQLTTLNNIMTSPAHSKPLSRTARHALGP
jgi:hypothetical protein